MDYSDSDESRGEEISLAEARRFYQISINNDQRPRLEMFQVEDKSIWDKKCCRWLRLLYPHIWLLFCTFAYIFAVAIAFYLIEGENEKMERVKLEMAIEIAQRNLMAQIHSMAPGIPVERLHQETAEFGREMLRLGWTRGRLGVPISAAGTAQQNASSGGGQDDGPIWSWANSLLFATSLIARIGYGHMFPLTQLGKLLVGPVILFGIPLFLVAVADVGKFYADFIQFCFLTCRRCWRKCRRGKRAVAGKKATTAPPQISANGPPKNQNASIKSSRSQQQQLEEGNATTPGGVSLNFSMGDDLGEDGGEEEADAHFPLLLPLALLLLALAALATLYSAVEGWAWFDGLYFAIGTAGAIGFGDFAPTSPLSALLTVGLIFPLFSLTIMLIDLAGTEYIRGIHYFDSKFESIFRGVKERVRRRKRKKKRPPPTRN